MDGLDLAESLARELPLNKVLERKVRRADVDARLGDDASHGCLLYRLGVKPRFRSALEGGLLGRGPSASPPPT